MAGTTLSEWHRTERGNRTDTPSRPRRSSALPAGLAGVLVVVLYIWDDVILATPIAATSRWLGSGTAFLLLTPVFFVISTFLALAAVRAHDRASAGRASRLEKYLTRQTQHRRGRLATRLMRATGVASFVLSSVLVGGMVTTWLMRYGGRREGITAVAVVSSLINAVTFVGIYSGLSSLVF